MTIFTLNAARYTTPPGVIGHQYQVATSQGYKGGECGAFLAALFFFYLNNDFLAFAQGFFDGGIADINPIFKVGSSNFFKWQEAVTLFTVIDKTGFERWLDARDNAFVNIAFALFATGSFNINID